MSLFYTFLNMAKRKFKITNPLTIVLMLLYLACSIESNEYMTHTATLYYTPACATINGYVILEMNQRTFVFQHEIEERFRKDSVMVKITYSLDKKFRVLTAECIQAPIINITSINDI